MLKILLYGSARERKIPYKEIDYIQSDNKKTIMYLTNGDREIISKNIGKINDEINRKYFVKCCMGVIVNIRNIHKIHRSEKKQGYRV